MFDDFLITTRELVNTCKFCPDTCAQKSVHDQIIEGLIDGGTIEDLLQEADLTLATTTPKLWSCEAASKSRNNTVVQDTDIVANLWKLLQTSHQFVLSMCLGCEARAHRRGCRQCPAYNRACLHCHKLRQFGKVCQGKQGSQRTTSGPHYTMFQLYNTINFEFCHKRVTHTVMFICTT